MKKIYFGVLAMAAFALSACSSDEPAPGDKDLQPIGDKYVAIKIHNVGSGSSRAEDSDFEVGIGKENDIHTKNCRFYFFDADNNPVILSAAGVNGVVKKTNMVAPLTISGDVNTTNGGDHTIDGVLVLGIDADNGYVGVAPTRMVCVANLHTIDGYTGDDPYEALADISLPELKNKLSATLSGSGLATDMFDMSSATYLDAAGKEVYWTELDGCLKETMEEATKAPAHVYLERLYAKVRVSGLKAYTSQAVDENGNITGDAIYKFYDPEHGIVEKKLMVTLNGWRLRNVFNQVKIIKSLTGTESNPLPVGYEFNDANLHRSYWAVTGSETSKLSQKSFNIYSETESYLGNYDVTSETTKQNTSRYILPSTAWWNQPNLTNFLNGEFAANGTEEYAKPVGNRITNCTAVVVKATVNFVNADGTIDTETDNNIIEWMGTYYKLADFKKIVFEAYKARFNGTTYTLEDVAIASADKNGKTECKNNTRKVMVGEDEFDMGEDVQFWENGLCSFYVNIQHDTVNGKPIFGIVRNHIYAINMTNVVGLGIPGNDIDNPTTPTNSYLACHIDVLNWRIVNKDVVLQ